MNKEQILEILELEALADEREIKNAYRTKLSVTNPEDDPEGFKALREAYETAIDILNNPQNDGEEEETVDVDNDDSPSGLWARGYNDIYSDFNKRCDMGCWEEYFNDDVFLSLDEEEACIDKLLYRISMNAWLPDEVWKLFNKKIHFLDDYAKLAERIPAGFLDYVKSKIVYESRIEVGATRILDESYKDIDSYLFKLNDLMNAVDDDRLEDAKKLIEETELMPVYNPAIDMFKAICAFKSDEYDEAVRYYENMDASIKKNYGCEEFFRKHGEKYIKELRVKYRKDNSLENAIDYATVLYRTGYVSDVIRLYLTRKRHGLDVNEKLNKTYATSLYNVGEYLEAMKYMEDLGPHFERNCYMELAVFKEEYALKAKGLLDKALEENPNDIIALYEKSSLLNSLGEYEKSKEIDEKLVLKYDERAALAGLIEDYYGLGDAQGVFDACNAMIEDYPKYYLAYERLGGMLLHFGDWDELRRMLDKAKTNEIKNSFIDALEYRISHIEEEDAKDDAYVEGVYNKFRELIDNDNCTDEDFCKAESYINELINHEPRGFVFKQRGMMYFRWGKTDLALEDFETAKRLSPTDGDVYDYLSDIYKRQGHNASALFHGNKGRYLDKDNEKNYAWYQRRMAKLYTRIGMHEKAIEAYNWMVQEGIDDGEKLSDCYLYLGDYEKAIEQLKHCMEEIDPDYENGNVFLEEAMNLSDLSGNTVMAGLYYDRYKDRESNRKIYHIGWHLALNGRKEELATELEKYIDKPIDDIGDLADLVFLSALAGSERLANGYSRRLYSMMAENKQAYLKQFVGAAKTLQFCRLAAAWTDDKAFVRVSKYDEKCSFCSFCKEVYCKEINGIKLIRLYTKGKYKTVYELMNEFLEKLPHDDYLLAMKATLFADVDEASLTDSDYEDPEDDTDETEERIRTSSANGSSNNNGQDFKSPYSDVKRVKPVNKKAKKEESLPVKILRILVGAALFVVFGFVGIIWFIIATQELISDISNGYRIEIGVEIILYIILAAMAAIAFGGFKLMTLNIKRKGKNKK